jgi:5'-nucleotidase
MFAFAFALFTACHQPPAATVTAVRPVTLHIAAINDFHGALYEKTDPEEPERAIGGLPWLVGAVDVLRSEDPELLLFDGGDSFQGDWPVNATRGIGAVQAFDLLRVDAAAVGNHEFDYGTGTEGSDPLHGALEIAAATRAQWLAANIEQVNADGSSRGRWSPPGIRPWTVLERRGVRVGVIGLSTMETPQTTLARNVADLRFLDPVATVREVLPEVRAAGAEVIVVVGHLTGKCEPKSFFEPAESCDPDGEVRRLLRELPQGTIDVLVVGHAHTLLAQRIGDTFVLENRSQGAAIGRLDLVVGPDGVDADASQIHAPWPITHEKADVGCSEQPFLLSPRDVGGRTIAPSTAALQLIAALEQQAGTLCEPMSCSTQFLGRSRTSESAVGNLVTDAMRAHRPQVDLAVQNSGGLRNDLPAGPWRRQNIHDVLPFENRLVEVELSGAQLRTLFRIGSSGAHGILQVSGARYRFDPEVKTGTDLDGDGAIADWERDRLCWVEVGGRPLNPEQKYRVATNDFITGGGDHFAPAFSSARVEPGPLLRDLVLQGLRQQTQCVDAAAPLVLEKQPRIEVGRCTTP